MADILDVLAIFYVLIAYLVLLPVVAYSVHQYEQTFRLQSHSVITFRDKKLIYSLNCIMLIKLLIERPFQLAYRVWLILDPSTLYLVQVFSEILMDAILILFCIKVYHLYFKYRYHSSIAQKAWRTDINPTDTNWYIVHKKTFGDPVWLMKCCITPFALFTIADMIVIFYTGESTLAYRLINAAVEISLVLVALISYWKIRRFHDAYHIRQEVLFQFASLSICFLLTFVIHSIFCEVPQIDLNAQADAEHDHLRNPRLHWLLIVYATAIGLIPFALSTLWYPLYLVDNVNGLKLTDAPSSSSPKSAQNSHKLHKMLLVIATEKYFRLFMQYLVQSLCCENLLFIVELIQIKLAHQEKNNHIVQVAKHDLSGYVEYDFNTNSDSDAKYAIIACRDCDGKLIYHRTSLADYHIVSYFKKKVFDSKSKQFLNLHVSLPSNLPQTVILDEKESFVDQMNELYLKYIKVDSQHELNISYEQRQLMDDFFQLKLTKISTDEHIEWRLYSVLDEVCVAVLHLMYGQFEVFLSRYPNVNKEINQLVDRQENNDEPESMMSVLERVRVNSF